MSTVLINVDDSSSEKLLLELARKMHFKARVLKKEQKEDLALLSIMEERSKEPSLPVESALKILRKTRK